MPLLEVEGLKVYYYTLRGVVRAVEDASLRAEQGELVAVVGESGSGKSTLGYAMLKLVPAPGKIVSGKVVVDGVEITSLRGERLRLARGGLVSMVFQDPFTTLDPVRRVGEQLAEVLVEHGIDSREAMERVPELLKAVKLPAELAHAYPHQLSGGQRQRVAIAAAIALRPRVLVADEPTTALDVIVQKQIMDLIDELRREMGMTVVLITHDIALAAERATSMAIMYAGYVVEYGPRDQVLGEPLHPYTKALLASVPDLESERWPKPIPGQPPDLRNPPSGCRFHPRCPLAMGICRRDPPPARWSGRRMVRCWLYGS
jgi:peptide/nickel transport system ATP-binding protein